MRVREKGQVTIPLDVRQRLGLEVGTTLEVEVVGDELRLRRAPGASRGQLLVERLRGAGSGTMTTDEILAMTRGE